MDTLDLNVYHGFRDALVKIKERLSKSNPPHYRLPIILADYYRWEVTYFEDEYKAVEHLEKHHSDWDDGPPQGEDEELVVYKFYTETEKLSYPIRCRGAKYFGEYGGIKYYRTRTYVSFEPELIINISI